MIMFAEVQLFSQSVSQSINLFFSKMGKLNFTHKYILLYILMGNYFIIGLRWNLNN